MASRFFTSLALVSLLTLPTAAVQAKTAPPGPGGIHLHRGGVTEVTVIGSKKGNDTGVIVRPGEKYSVRVPPGQTWIDLFIKTTAEGFSSKQKPIFKRFDHELKLPTANWLELCGQIGAQQPFAVGLGRELPRHETGRLSLFANDVSWGYWDNIGSLKVIIRRTK